MSLKYSQSSETIVVAKGSLILLLIYIVSKERKPEVDHLQQLKIRRFIRRDFILGMKQYLRALPPLSKPNSKKLTYLTGPSAVQNFVNQA